MMHPPFVILALPRSRTFWISRLLTYGDWTCEHDELRHVRSLADVWSWLSQPMVGSVETAAAPHWRLLREQRPDVRIATIRRPVDEVVDSLMQLNLGHDEEATERAMQRLDAKLDQVEARIPGVVRVDFAELDTEAGCRRLWEHCLPYPFNPAWWERLATLDLQINFAAMVRYMQAHKPQLDKVVAQARQHTLARLQRRPVAEPAGVTFQVEPWGRFYADGQHLFRQHCTDIEEHPLWYQDINVPLFEQLEEAGALQVTTARCNGRMYGYLITIIAPGLRDPARVTAQHTSFYGSPDLPGLGLKLQRAALAYLAERGVDEVSMRAGVRGAGPRLGRMYMRLGAVPDGQLYTLGIQREAS